MATSASFQCSIQVRLGDEPLPFITEYPYFLWGEVNYDSDGDCTRPTDRSWHWLYFRHRGTGERLTLLREGDNPTRCIVVADRAESAQLAAYLTAVGSGGRVVDWASQQEIDPDSYAAQLRDVPARLAQAQQVCDMFLNPALAPFDSHAWWVGWKWTRRLASTFTTGSRLAMLAVQERHVDPETLAELRKRWQAGPNDAARRDTGRPYSRGGGDPMGY